MKQSYEFKTFCLIFLTGMLILSSAKSSESGAGKERQLEGYPIDTNVLTTLQRTVLPVDVPLSSLGIYPYQVSNYYEYGYGVWESASGVDYVKRLDIMLSDYSGPSRMRKSF